MKPSKPSDVDAYIARAAREARPKLRELREIIRSATPKADERISWSVPFSTYHGELVGFAALKTHVSVGIGSIVIQQHVRAALDARGYATGKATIQIRFDQKLPTEEIKPLLRTKAKLNETKSRSHH